ncbi:MAG: anthranilate synthase component I family protein [Mongoliibacter sp.]|uniref:anthranilate synthase component I family protein n=1 Tax=Mongoliibacter sp. TaxID=2022438 RepID=UPI0012F3A361|nr:anthranilate synthase component I family protein [Mongoliibacter sp.]TVP46385.1 MAG: anthranilate synthase component I family protein [Mongoliibacter sp.]
MSNNSEIRIPKPNDWESKLVNWLDLTFPEFCFQTGKGFHYPFDPFPDQAFGSFSKLTLAEAIPYYGKSDLVAMIAYDYKNEIEKLSSNNSTLIDLDSIIFFIPELRIEIGDKELHFKGKNCKMYSEAYLEYDSKPTINPTVKVRRHSSENDYTDSVRKIQTHILEGDVYELNYCMGFSFDHTDWNPVQGFIDLMKKSPMPFSGIFKSGHKYLISASPERFLKKTGSRLYAQPIKGTIKRSADLQEDIKLKDQLLASEKERAENLMIVDLMRNDMSKISEIGSVSVEELFGIYSFPRVHQMISTVTSKIQENLGLLELIHATFPMGSMTGAPKIKCMELIEKYENFKRGWFSGSFGVFNANGDFDLNVVIRSIVYDKEMGKGYFAVGSAITYDADPAYEYQECLLKASAILEILEGK